VSTDRVTTRPAIRFDPTTPEQRENPFDVLALARREQPVLCAPRCPASSSPTRRCTTASASCSAFRWGSRADPSLRTRLAPPPAGAAAPQARLFHI